MYKYVSVLVLVFSFGAGYVSADEDEDIREPEVSVIQDKIRYKKHEVGLSLGHIPDNNFYEVFPVTFNYIYHFNQHFAWEVVRGGYMVNQERQIKEDLELNFGVTPQTFDQPIALFETSLIIKPSYGKDSIWNKGILNHEGYLILGAGVATFERQFNFGEAETETAFTASIGIGRKYFIGENFNINLELRDTVVFKETKTENNVYIGFGINFRFGLFDRKRPEDKRTRSIYDYLEKE